MYRIPQSHFKAKKELTQQEKGDAMALVCAAFQDSGVYALHKMPLLKWTDFLPRFLGSEKPTVRHGSLLNSN